MLSVHKLNVLMAYSSFLFIGAVCIWMHVCVGMCLCANCFTLSPKFDPNSNSLPSLLNFFF